jgi:carbonic anhydrase
MKKQLYISTLTSLIFLGACRNTTDQATNGTNTLSTVAPPLREHVITAAEQKALTPDRIIEDLKAGNKHYTSSHLTANDYMGMMKTSSEGQYPEAFILACIDSRVPVEEIFDKGIGDLFVGRVAGNIVDEDVLGSMEYGCKVAGAKLIVVLGHQSCGAVKAAIENEELGNITAMLMKIKPALARSSDFNGEQSAENGAFVDYVVRKNIQNTIQNIGLKSLVLKNMADHGEIKIVGAYYSFETGEVIFLDGN